MKLLACTGTNICFGKERASEYACSHSEPFSFYHLSFFSLYLSKLNVRATMRDVVGSREKWRRESVKSQQISLVRDGIDDGWWLEDYAELIDAEQIFITVKIKTL